MPFTIICIDCCCIISSLIFVIFYFPGGCKHAISFLTWLHQRSEEPARKSLLCLVLDLLLNSSKQRIWERHHRINLQI